MIENLQDELSQLENKQAKGAKFGAFLFWLILAGSRVGEGQNANFEEKTPHIHLIIIREWPKNNTPYI